MDPTDIRSAAERLRADLEHARRAVRDEMTALASARETLAAAEEGQKILQEVAASLQETAHAQIAEVVSKCLETVFEEPYTFKIVFEQKRGKTEARLTLVRDGRELAPADAVGGGVIDVVSFALRLAALLLTRPARRRLLVLDEPFRMLSKDYAPRVRELLESLAAELDLQIVMVTHSPLLACGKVVEIGQ